MTRIQLRLECLKLVCAPGRDVDDAVTRAKILEAFALGEEEKELEGELPKLPEPEKGKLTTKLKPGPKPKADNASILD